MTQKQLIKVAKLEMREWRNIPEGLVIVILWAFIHRVTTGNTVEETFFQKRLPVIDYEI